MIKCPFRCTQLTSVPQNNAAQLPNNFLLQQIIQQEQDDADENATNSAQGKPLLVSNVYNYMVNIGQ